MLRLFEIPQDGLTLHRIVKTDNRDRADPVLMDSLRSSYEQQRPPRRYERRLTVIHMGISAFETKEQAVTKAHEFPKIGEYVAELGLTPGHGFVVTPDTGEPGHLTIWGRPDELYAAIVEIPHV